VRPREKRKCLCMLINWMYKSIAIILKEQIGRSPEVRKTESPKDKLGEIISTFTTLTTSTTFPTKSLALAHTNLNP
jgi:hypothetical protein